MQLRTGLALERHLWTPSSQHAPPSPFENVSAPTASNTRHVATASWNLRKRNSIGRLLRASCVDGNGVAHGILSKAGLIIQIMSSLATLDRQPFPSPAPPSSIARTRKAWSKSHERLQCTSTAGDGRFILLHVKIDGSSGLRCLSEASQAADLPQVHKASSSPS